MHEGSRPPTGTRDSDRSTPLPRWGLGTGPRCPAQHHARRLTFLEGNQEGADFLTPSALLLCTLCLRKFNTDNNSKKEKNRQTNLQEERTQTSPWITACHRTHSALSHAPDITPRSADAGTYSFLPSQTLPEHRLRAVPLLGAAGGAESKGKVPGWSWHGRTDGRL